MVILAAKCSALYLFCRYVFFSFVQKCNCVQVVILFNIALLNLNCGTFTSSWGVPMLGRCQFHCVIEDFYCKCTWTEHLLCLLQMDWKRWTMLFIQRQAAKRNAKTVCVSGACKECYVLNNMHYFHTSWNWLVLN